ncbi:MAG: hypothetical protein ACRDJ5_04355 [Actinomycetota bacterium]
MTRARRAEDWARDLSLARAGESRLAQILRADARLDGVEDHTGDYERLDFSFRYRGLEVRLDLKEKRQPYSARYRQMWPEVEAPNLFIVDETVFRRVVWQGGGGYLVVHDLPERRWLFFGPWELTLGPRRRYRRWGRRAGPSFSKGKLLLDLGAAAHEASSFTVDDLLEVIDRSRGARDGVEAVPIRGQDLPEIT